MRSFAAVSLLVALAVGGGGPTATPECPVFMHARGSECNNESNKRVSRCDTFGKDTQPFLDTNYTYCGNKAGMLAAWEGAVHFTFPRYMQSGTAIKVSCPNNWGTCEMLINLYVCPGCSSSSARTTTGKWPSSLAAHGWTAAGYSAAFCDSEGGQQHPMVGFHKQIFGGWAETVPVTATETMYLSLMVKEGKECQYIMAEEKCTAAPLCQWDPEGLWYPNGWLHKGVCLTHWAPPTVGNPNTCASSCAPGTPILKS